MVAVEDGDGGAGDAADVVADVFGEQESIAIEKSVAWRPVLCVHLF